jgi:hypothetical protein
MLRTMKPPSETQAVIHRVGKICPRGFVVKKNKPPDRESNTLDNWTYLITLLVTKGTDRKTKSER